MKFIISIILFLLVSTTTLSKSILKRGIMKKTGNFDAYMKTVSEACRQELYSTDNDINKCIIHESIIVNDKGACPDFDSPTCQNVYNDIMSYLPSCQEYPEIVQTFSPEYMKVILAKQKFYCQKDENGASCPYPDILSEYNASNEELIPTCNSKICTEQLIEIFESFSSNLNNMSKGPFINGTFSKNKKNNTKIMLDYLKSEECTSQASNNNFNNNVPGNSNNDPNNNTNNFTNSTSPNDTTNNGIIDNKSDAKTLKVGITFLISLSFVLLSIY